MRCNEIVGVKASGPSPALSSAHCAFGAPSEVSIHSHSTAVKQSESPAAPLHLVSLGPGRTLIVRPSSELMRWCESIPPPPRKVLVGPGRELSIYPDSPFLGSVAQYPTLLGCCRWDQREAEHSHPPVPVHGDYLLKKVRWDPQSASIMP